MKQSHLLTAACLTTALLGIATAPLHAGIRFARGEITARGTAQISFTDRVRPSSEGTSDTIYSFTPAINYQREGARLNLNAELSKPFVRYGSAERLNSDRTIFDVSGNVPYSPASRLSGTWNVGYFEGIESNEFLNRNQSTERFDADINSNLRLLRNFSLKAGARYSDRSSEAILSDAVNANTVQSYNIGLQAHNFIRGRAGAYITYRWQERETTKGSVNSNVNDTDTGLNFGLTGQILPERLFPKLDADLSFGISSSKDLEDRGADRNHLTINGKLSYPPTSKTNVALNYRRNLSVSDDDRSVLVSRIILDFNYTPRQKLSLGASVGSDSHEFLDGGSDREDSALFFRANARYSIRRNWSASVFYNFRDTSSDLAIADYTSSTCGLSTTITY